MKNIIKDTNIRPDFCTRFQSLVKGRRAGDVWADFIVSVFCSRIFPENEVSQAELCEITKRYNLKEGESLAEMYVLLDKLLTEYAEEDFWGRLWEDLGILDVESPYNISDLQQYIRAHWQAVRPCS